jgi:hypothetical protein
MKNKGSSEHHQNNNLKVVIASGNFIGKDNSFLDIKKKNKFSNLLIRHLMNIYNRIKKEVRRSNLVIPLSFILVVIIIIPIVGVLFSISISPVVFAQSSSSPNSILDEYTYVCIKLNETIEERGIPDNMNTDFLNTEEICNMLLQGMGYLDKQEILKKYE